MENRLEQMKLEKEGRTFNTTVSGMIEGHLGQDGSNRSKQERTDRRLQRNGVE